MLPSVPDPVRIPTSVHGNVEVTLGVLERLDALSFEPTRSHRKALYRFNRQMIEYDDDASESEKLGSKNGGSDVGGGTNDQYAVLTRILL